MVATGAGIAAIAEFKAFGITVMIVGGIVMFVGFIAVTLGVQSHLRKLDREQHASKERELARDAREEERLEMDRRLYALNLQKLESSSVENQGVATALEIEVQELVAQRVKQEAWLKTASDYSDGPRTKILTAELEVNRLRLAAVELQLERLSAEVPTRAERQKEMRDTLNWDLRQLG